MAMGASPWSWTPYGGCDYYGGPQLANRAPWYGYPSPSPSFASGYGVACGNSADLGGQSGGAHRVFVEMPPAYEHIPSHAPGPGSAHDHVKRTCGNVSMGSSDSDNTYWNIHTYQMPDHAQKICNIDFTSSDASDDCYWSVHTFPLSNTKAHVSQAQSCLLEGMVGDSMIVPPKAECEDMQVQKVSNHGLEDSTLECGILNQLSQLCEKNGNNTTHENFGEQMEEEIAEYLTKSKHNEEEAQRKREEEEPGSGAMGEREVGLDLFFADAFELFDPGINTGVHQFIYALPVSYLQQLQQHMTCQPVVSTACALLAKNAEISLLNLQPSQLFFGEIFYTGKPPMRYDGFGLPTGDDNDVIQSTISIELNWPWDPGSLGSDFKTKLLVLTYATLNAELLLPWDPGEHETFVRFIDTSGTTCQQKFLMCAVNWHFVNLKEFEGSGDCTSKDHQLQARRICSSYSLAGSLGNYRSKIRTEWFLLQSDTTNVHPLLPWDPGDQEILLLIMLALNWHFLTLKAFQGSGEDTKQAVLLNNVNIPSCTLDMTTAMVVYMGSHKGIMMSDVSWVPPLFSLLL